MKLTRKKGFTLIEILVVIAIIGILATVGISSFRRAQERARDARRQSDLSSIRNALEIYYADNNQYVDTGDSWGAVDSVLDSLTPVYIKELPSDPGGAGQTYRYRSVGLQEYCLEAFLEASDQPTGTPRLTEDNNCTVRIQNGYNYGVSSP